MNDDTWKRVERLFYKAIERDPPARSRFLDEVCDDDPAVRREVAALLEHHTQTGNLFASARELADDLRRSASEFPLEGRSIGPYRIEREIGAGGMGRVFLAEREDLPKRVALKLVREPLASPDRIARFRLEQRVLAGLDHPHIAQLVDAGVTDDGAPYFAMEYVDGDPLSTYSDRRRLTVADRLRLFLDVCAAVRYAHAHLVMHRDIKPTNILVSADGGVKLLDFGVAKLLTPAEEHDPTGSSTRVFTPNYASPEQFTGDPVTTATDVYQLGALLYESMVGRPPLDLAGKTPAEAERIVREQEPVPPSSAVTRALGAGTPAAAAANRSSTPEGLRHRLRGDIDTIVLKALEKRPARRYPSVDALAADVERFLEGRPVRARPATPAYRLRKFVLRHRVAAVIAALVLGYAVTATWSAVGIARERDRAEREAAEAQRQAAKSEQVTAFLLGLFEASDPSVAQGDTLTARVLLDRGVERAGQFANQPEVQATLLGVTGRSHFNLGNVEEAEALLRQALQVWERAPDPDPRAIAEVQLALAEAYDLQSRFEESSAIYRAVIEAGAGDELAAIRTDALYGLFTALHGLGRREPADSAFQLWAAAVEEAPLRPDPRTAEQMVSLGQMLHYGGDLEKAEVMLRRGVVHNRAVYGDQHPNLGNALNALAALLVQDSVATASADSVTRESVDLHRRVFPDGHPQLSLALSYRARFLQARERVAEAEALLREAVALETPSPSRDGLRFITRNRELALVLAERGAFDEAASRLRQGRDWWERNFGPDYPFTLVAVVDLADALAGLGAYAEAESLLVVSHERLRDLRGNEDDYTQHTVERLIALYEAWDRPEAEERYRKLLVP